MGKKSLLETRTADEAAFWREKRIPHQSTGDSHKVLLTSPGVATAGERPNQFTGNYLELKFFYFDFEFEFESFDIFRFHPIVLLTWFVRIDIFIFRGQTSCQDYF